MAANALPSPKVTIAPETAVDHVDSGLNESCLPMPLKERVVKVLHEVFEGHEEFLGATPD
jgi:hypothetical protein